MAQRAEPPRSTEITLEAWAALDEEDRRELVDGILVEEEMPTTVHELVVAWLIGCRGERGGSWRTCLGATGSRWTWAGSGERWKRW